MTIKDKLTENYNLLNKEKKEFVDKMFNCVDKFAGYTTKIQSGNSKKNSFFIDNLCTRFSTVTYSGLNKKFKRIFFNKSSDSRTGNIYIRSIFGKSIQDLMLVLKCQTDRQIKSKNGYVYQKFKFDLYNIDAILSLVTVLAFKRSESVTVGELSVAYFKAVIEFFYTKDIIWNEVINRFPYFLNADYSNIKSFNEQYLDEYEKTQYENRSKARTGLTYNKVEILEEEILEVIKDYPKKKDLVEYFMNKYNISNKTVRRRLAEAGYSKEYYTTKKNLNKTISNNN